MTIWQSLNIAAPELFITLGALLGVTIGAFADKRFSQIANMAFALVLAIAAAISLGRIGGETISAFGGLYIVNDYILAAKAIVFGLAALSLLVADNYLIKRDMQRYEFSLLLAFAAMGGALMLSAGNLMTLYLGIEMLSLPSYALTAFARDNETSSEAGLKYFVLGALASGLYLFGASVIYGFSGGTDYQTIAQAEMTPGLAFGMVLVLSGLAFKASAAPFHIWTPDVYQGAPTPVTIFFSASSKFATVLVFGLLVLNVFYAHFAQLLPVVAVIAALSMLVGAFGGLGQNNLRRLFAYSSIANVGFALMALSVGAGEGHTALFVYMTIYAISSFALFLFILALQKQGNEFDTLEEIEGLAQQKPWLAVVILALVASIAGIPPFAGFWGKWMVFEATIKAEMYWLVFVAIVASVVSLGYYLRILKAVWFGDMEETPERTKTIVSGLLVMSALALFPVLTFWIGGLTGFASALSTG